MPQRIYIPIGLIAWVLALAIALVRRARRGSVGGDGRPSLQPSPIAAWLGERMPPWLRMAWMLAARYLGRHDPLSWRAHIITILFAVSFALAVGVTFVFDYIEDPKLLPYVYEARGYLFWVKLGLAAATVLLFVFISLVRKLSLFSTISTFGLFLGCSALVIILSIMSGFEADLRGKIVGLNAHIQVTKEEGAFTDYDKVATEISGEKDVIGASPYLSDELIISTSSSSSAVLLRGVDVATVKTVSEIGGKIDPGELELLADPERLRDYHTPSRFLPEDPDDDEPEAESPLGPSKPVKGEPGAGTKHFAPGDNTRIADPDAEPRRTLPGVLIGRELSRSLHAYVGDEVSLISPQGGIGPTGVIPKSKPFRVAGIFFTGMYEYDSKHAFIALPAAQKFCERPDEATGVEVKLRNIDLSPEVAARLRARLGNGFEVRDWREMNSGLFAALKLERILMFIVLCFIVLVAAFSIIANGVVLVFEKRREIAMLRAMGIETRTVVVVFLLLGTFLAGIGVVAGLIAGLAGCWALETWGFPLNHEVYYITKLPVQIAPLELAVICAACFALALLATIYPAVLGSRLEPVDGLRR